MNLFLSAHAGLAGLIFFFAVFTGIAFWTLLPHNRRKLESYKYIPLSEDGHDLRS